MNYEIAIPSLGRCDVLQKMTLNTLRFHGMVPSKVTVFVVEEEYETYRAALQENIKIVVGVRGIIQQRKFIHHYYDVGTHVICIDDDIEQIDLSLGNCRDLNTFFITAFDDLEEKNAHLWGVYPVWNKFFREQRPPMSDGLTFIIGCLYGVIIRHDADLETTVATGEKEDHERTLRYYIKDGSVIRYNRIGVKTKFFSKGGIGLYKQRKESLKDDAYRIAESFSIYGKLVERKNGKFEFKFESIARRIPSDAVTKLERVSPDEFDTLVMMLSKTKIPRITSKINGGTARKGFDTHNGACLGIVQQRVGRAIAQSAFSKKYPLVHDEIWRIGKKIVPFHFTSVHLNNNVICPPHVDGKNTGVSCIVSFGEYEGGKLMVAGVEYDAWCQPLTFNGSVLPHWNTPLEEGSNKYSLIFYNHGACLIDKE